MSKRYGSVPFYFFFPRIPHTDASEFFLQRPLFHLLFLNLVVLCCLLGLLSFFCGEKIDIINWDENAAQFIENALSPSKVIFVAVDDDEHSALVVVPDSQLSLAIGKAGQNARLTAKLTGYKIDIKSESQAEEEGLFDEIDFSAAEETEQTEEAAQDNEVQE